MVHAETLFYEVITLQLTVYRVNFPLQFELKMAENVRKRL